MLNDVLAARPDYALAWHNLGVDHEAWSMSAYLRSQGELGRAALLSSSLRDADLELRRITSSTTAGSTFPPGSTRLELRRIRVGVGNPPGRSP